MGKYGRKIYKMCSFKKNKTLLGLMLPLRYVLLKTFAILRGYLIVFTEAMKRATEKQDPIHLSLQYMKDYRLVSCY